MIRDRVDDICDVLAIINTTLAWQHLSNEAREQLLVFKDELEQELRFLLEAEDREAA
jgi:hypothetical protein